MFSVMSAWKLSTKFSLWLLILFLLGSSMTVLTLSNHLNHQAERAVKERAEIIISTMQAARNYTRDNIQPAFENGETTDGTDIDKIRFRRESIPNFAAQSIFSDFRQQSTAFQDFSYKEAAMNPTNPDDLADDFEADILARMQSMTNSTTDLATYKGLSGYRTQGDKKLFYLARPLVLKDASCLGCHGKPADAPVTMVEMYGNQNGFGWQLNDLVATQMIYVPADTIFNRGRENLWTVTKIFFSIFGAVFVMMNLLLWRMVTHPLAILTNVAKQISRFSDQSQPDSAHMQRLTQLTKRRDEPGQLARAFEYMVHVLGRREKDLQVAVQDRTRSLESEMQERQRAQEALQTYNHAINHDLRNLVMGISMLVQGIARRGAPSSPQPADSTNNTPTPVEIEPMALTMIQKSCDRQINLMNSLVDVRSSEIWRTVLRSQSVDLTDIIEDVAASYKARLSITQSTLTSQLPQQLPQIQADPGQLKRVFENLIDNALKYNPTGIHIVVSVTVMDTRPSLRSTGNQPNIKQQLYCTISDNGIGIDPNEKNDLFKIYSRGQRDRETLGDGLGLYICRQIVEAHGGNIGITNQPTAGGAEFWFTLPV